MSVIVKSTFNIYSFKVSFILIFGEIVARISVFHILRNVRLYLYVNVPPSFS